MAAPSKWVDLTIGPSPPVAGNSSVSMTLMDLMAPGGEGAAPCELMLLAKDGNPLMALPRRVAHIMMPSGGR